MHKPGGVMIIGLVSMVAALLLTSPIYAQSPKQTPSTKPDQNAPKAELAKQKPPAAPKVLKIALFQLETSGVEPKLASVVSDMVFAEMGKLPNSSVIGSKEIDTMLGYEQKKQVAGCTDTSCVVAIGGALGVDKIVLGSIGKVGTSYVFNLKLLNMKTAEAKVENVYSKRVKGGTEEDFLDAIPEAMRTLFPANASVWPDQNASSQVTANKVGPWVLVGAGGAAAIVGGVLNGLAVSDYNEWKKVPESDPRNQSLKDSAQTKATTAYVLYGVGAGAIAGGLIWYFVTREKPKDAKKAALDLTFQPIIGGDVTGGMVMGSW